MAMAPTRKLYKLRHHSLCQCYLHRKALVNLRSVKWCWHNTATPILLNSLLHDGSNKDKILWNKQIFHFHCLADLASITIITILRLLQNPTFCGACSSAFCNTWVAFSSLPKAPMLIPSKISPRACRWDSVPHEAYEAYQLQRHSVRMGSQALRN